MFREGDFIRNKAMPSIGGIVIGQRVDKETGHVDYKVLFIVGKIYYVEGKDYELVVPS